MKAIGGTLSREKRNLKTLNIVFLVLMVLNLFPFFLVLMNSFKSSFEIAKSILNFPEHIGLDNYIKAWKTLEFPKAFLNTLIVTVIGNAGLIVFGTMTGYWITRSRTHLFNKLFFWLLLASMAVPFEALMVPMMKVTRVAHLNGSLWGLGVSYWGLGAAMVVFLTSGAVKSIPYELEEAARIDGCTRFATFWRVVFPLLRNTVATFTVLNVFWLWNDYLMPQLMLGRTSELYTIQLAMRSLFLEYYAMWDVALAALILSLMPILIFFFIGQRYMVSGIVTGAIKG